MGEKNLEIKFFYGKEIASGGDFISSITFELQYLTLNYTKEMILAHIKSLNPIRYNKGHKKYLTLLKNICISLTTGYICIHTSMHTYVYYKKSTHTQ